MSEQGSRFRHSDSSHDEKFRNSSISERVDAASTVRTEKKQQLQAGSPRGCTLCSVSVLLFLSGFLVVFSFRVFFLFASRYHYPLA